MVQQIITNDNEIYQIITLLVIFFLIGLEVYQWITEPQERYWFACNLLWMIHGAFFYVFITLDRYVIPDLIPMFGSYTLWSSVLRLHIIGTFAIVEYARVRQRRLRKLKQKLTQELFFSKELEASRKLVLENQELLRKIHFLLEEKGGGNTDG